jgi:hypothetical protein
MIAIPTIKTTRLFIVMKGQRGVRLRADDIPQHPRMALTRARINPRAFAGAVIARFADLAALILSALRTSDVLACKLDMSNVEIVSRAPQARRLPGIREA